MPLPPPPPRHPARLACSEGANYARRVKRALRVRPSQRQAARQTQAGCHRPAFDHAGAFFCHQPVQAATDLSLEPCANTALVGAAEAGLITPGAWLEGQTPAPNGRGRRRGLVTARRRGLTSRRLGARPRYLGVQWGSTAPASQHPPRPKAQGTRRGILEALPISDTSTATPPPVLTRVLYSYQTPPGDAAVQFIPGCASALGLGVLVMPQSHKPVLCDSKLGAHQTHHARGLCAVCCSEQHCRRPSPTTTPAFQHLSPATRHAGVCRHTSRHRARCVRMPRPRVRTPLVRPRQLLLCTATCAAAPAAHHLLAYCPGARSVSLSALRACTTAIAPRTAGGGSRGHTREESAVRARAQPLQSPQA